jgi:Uma2 family endonuclease
MEQEPSNSLTLEGFLKLPETQPPQEYLKGQTIPKPTPEGERQIIQEELIAVINQIVKPKQIACAFPARRCTFGDCSIVPDISVFIESRIPHDENGELANTFPLFPDWTIEILSGDQSATKVMKNILYSLKQGTEMGWLIDPKQQTVFIFQGQQTIEVFDEPESMLPIPSFASNVYLTVKELFAWLWEEQNISTSGIIYG